MSRMETLLQSHIRLGKVSVKKIVNTNIILAVMLLFITSYAITTVLPDAYRHLGGWWFIWGFFGAAISFKTNPSKRVDLGISLPAHVCTHLAAYTISGIYWLYVKLFTKS